MGTHKLRNWTILPVLGVTPDKAHATEGYTSAFPRMMGDTSSYRRIHAPWERAKEDECCMIVPVDVMSSEIMKVHNNLDDSVGVSVTTRSGNVYQLEGEPRPSFKAHCKAFDIDHSNPAAVSLLVDALNKAMREEPE